MSKVQFTCSEDHFEKGYVFLRFFQNCFRTLSDNRPDLWQKFSTALPKLHSACPKNFSIFFAVVCHVLFNFGFKIKKILASKKSFVSFVKFAFYTSENVLRNSIHKNDFFQFSLNFQPKLFELWQNCSTESLTCSFRVQRNTFTKTLCWLCETIFDFGKGNVWFAAEKLQPCYQLFSFVSRWAIGRIVVKEFLLFLIFFGGPGNISWCFRCIIPGMVVQINFHQPRGTYPLRKNFRKNFCPFRTMSGIF